MNNLAKITLSFFLVFFSNPCTIIADDVEAIKNKIAQVKKNNVYLYGEATAPTVKEATELAEDILAHEITQWATTKKKMQDAENFLINNKESTYQILTTPRGNQYRAVVYVKKSDIQKANNPDVISNLLSNNAPATSVGMRQTRLDTAEHSKETEGKPQVYSSVYPDVIKKIAKTEHYDDLTQKIIYYKNEGSIIRYARYEKNSTGTEQCYFAIYDKEGNVRALLTPGPERINVRNSKEDNLNNYHGCGAIMFEVKE